MKFVIPGPEAVISWITKGGRNKLNQDVILELKFEVMQVFI